MPLTVLPVIVDRRNEGNIKRSLRRCRHGMVCKFGLRHRYSWRHANMSRYSHLPRSGKPCLSGHLRITPGGLRHRMHCTSTTSTTTSRGSRRSCCRCVVRIWANAHTCNDFLSTRATMPTESPDSPPSSMERTRSCRSFMAFATRCISEYLISTSRASHSFNLCMYSPNSRCCSTVAICADRFSCEHNSVSMNPQDDYIFIITRRISISESNNGGNCTTVYNAKN